MLKNHSIIIFLFFLRKRIFHSPIGAKNMLVISSVKWRRVAIMVAFATMFMMGLVHIKFDDYAESFPLFEIDVEYGRDNDKQISSSSPLKTLRKGDDGYYFMEMPEEEDFQTSFINVWYQNYSDFIATLPSPGPSTEKSKIELSPTASLQANFTSENV